MFGLGAQVGMQFGLVAWQEWLMLHIGRNGAALQPIFEEASKRKGVSRKIGRMVAESRGEVPGRRTFGTGGRDWQLDNEEKNAVEATRQLGLVPPPRGTVGAYELVYEPFGTAFERISELGFGSAIRQ